MRKQRQIETEQRTVASCSCHFVMVCMTIGTRCDIVRCNGAYVTIRWTLCKSDHYKRHNFYRHFFIAT